MIDPILLEQLGIKKTRAVIIDTDCATEEPAVTVPSVNTICILLTSGSPIQNLKNGYDLLSL